MELSNRAGLLKRVILLFWSVWITVVVGMNIGDGLKALGILPEDWKVASGNYEQIVKVSGIYGTPRWLDFALFLGAAVWEMICALLFWWALRRFAKNHRRSWRLVYLAFTSLLALFCAFILSDEIFHAYKVEGDHRGIAVLLLASLLALQLLPERARDS
jgi:membrane associated rhomboid family serine protease